MDTNSDIYDFFNEQEEPLIPRVVEWNPSQEEAERIMSDQAIYLNSPYLTCGRPGDSCHSYTFNSSLIDRFGIYTDPKTQAIDLTVYPKRKPAFTVRLTSMGFDYIDLIAPYLEQTHTSTEDVTHYELINRHDLMGGNGPSFTQSVAA